MRVTIIFAVVLGIAVALPKKVDDVNNVLESTGIATRNTALEQMVLDIIEELREVMINGSDDIPVLDPLEIDHLHLELDSFGLDGSHITVGDVIVNKLSTFEIDDLSLRMTSLLPPRYTMDIEGHIADLEIDAGKYDMDITVIGFNVFGNGRAKINIIKPKIKGTFVLSAGLIGGISLNMISANVGFSLDEFKPEMTGMFDSDVVNDFINLFLANLVPEMVEFFEEDITQILSTLILEVANDLLADLDIGGIINPNALRLALDAPALEKTSNLEIKV